MIDSRHSSCPRPVAFFLLLACFLMGGKLAADDGESATAGVDAAATGDSGDGSCGETDSTLADGGDATAVERLGEDVPLQDRFFRRPRDFFMRSCAGERFQLHYERFDKHEENIPIEPLSPAEARAFQTERSRTRPVYETVGYEPGAHSVRVWYPEGFDEAEIGEWGLFLYVSSEDAPDVPHPLRDILTEHKMIFASPNGAGQGKPDVLRISLLLDTLKLMQDTHPRMHRRKTMVYGEGEAGQMALLTVMNFPDRFRNCAVVPVDASLTKTSRYTAGTFERVNQTGVSNTVTFFHPITAPYFSPNEYRKMGGVTFLYVLTSRQAIGNHYARIMDWGELTGDRRFRPFWYPGGLTSDGMGVLLQALDGRRQVLDRDSVPVEMRPKLESDRRR